MLSIVSLLVVLALSILVTRIATVALTHTGMSRESAKFQARSAFTGVGFTTNESEKVVNHPIRRRILLLLMLLGNAGVVTAVSSLILSFVDLDTSGQTMLWRVVWLVTGLVALWSLASSQWMDRHLSTIVSKALKRYTSLKIQDFARLLHLSGDYQVTELQVRSDDWLAGRTLADLGLRQEGIMVLGITRNNGDYLGAPDGETEVKADDALILYGRAGVMKDLDERKRGFSGNMAHHQRTLDQKNIERQEKEK